jgi:divalent metal cation (Fe/Co/Zn/Cd) transporter
VKLERWGWYSVLVNVLLASLHGLIAGMSGSLAVFAELVHNLLDLLGAVAVLVGIRLVARKSRAFPYGLYKIESLIALGLAGLVLLTAYEIARDALFAPLAIFKHNLGCLCY